MVTVQQPNVSFKTLLNNSLLQSSKWEEFDLGFMGSELLLLILHRNNHLTKASELQVTACFNPHGVDCSVEVSNMQRLSALLETTEVPS